MALAAWPSFLAKKHADGIIYVYIICGHRSPAGHRSFCDEHHPKMEHANEASIAVCLANSIWIWFVILYMDGQWNISELEPGGHKATRSGEQLMPPHRSADREFFLVWVGTTGQTKRCTGFDGKRNVS